MTRLAPGDARDQGWQQRLDFPGPLHHLGNLVVVHHALRQVNAQRGNARKRRMANLHPLQEAIAITIETFGHYFPRHGLRRQRASYLRPAGRMRYTLCPHGRFIPGASVVAPTRR